MSKPKWYTWTVRYSVSAAWVEDGFELTEERAKDMIEATLPYSQSLETKAKVLTAPDPDAIAKEQGYKSAEHRKEVESRA